MRNMVTRLIMALDTEVQEFQFQNFSPNAVAKVIVNTIVGLIVIVGVVYGGWMLGQGFTSEDPKEKRNGITAILSSLIVGGLVIAVVNMIIS